MLSKAKQELTVTFGFLVAATASTSSVSILPVLLFSAFVLSPSQDPNQNPTLGGANTRSTPRHTEMTEGETEQER